MHTREKIKQMRKRLGISAQILAERIGVSKATLYRYESGGIEKIPMHVLEKIAAVLDCNILSFTEKEVRGVAQRYYLSANRRASQRGRRQPCRTIYRGV